MSKVFSIAFSLPESDAIVLSLSEEQFAVPFYSTLHEAKEQFKPLYNTVIIENIEDLDEVGYVLLRQLAKIQPAIFALEETEMLAVIQDWGKGDTLRIRNPFGEGNDIIVGLVNKGFIVAYSVLDVVQDLVEIAKLDRAKIFPPSDAS